MQNQFEQITRIMNNRTKILQKLMPVKGTEKKWEDIKAEYIRLYVEGWNEDYIFDTLTEKFYMKISTLHVNLKKRALREIARKEITRIKKKTGRMPGENAMADLNGNGAEFRTM